MDKNRLEEILRHAKHKQDRFFAGKPVLLEVSILDWQAVYSWIIPSDCVKKVETMGESYLIQLVAGKSIKELWEL